MDSLKIILIIGIILVLIYDFTNGFHDAADMIATAIASRAIKPDIAIIIVTVFTFLGPFLGGLAVADTIGEFVKLEGVDHIKALSVAMAAIMAAISYNLITWKFGLPSSSSNSLTSGLVGAGVFVLGNSHIHWGISELVKGEIAGFMKIIAGMIFSPFFGLIAGFLIMKLFLFLFRRLTIKSKPIFVFTQYLTVGWLAFSHGTNDAQKGMGVMGMLLLASGVYSTFFVPTWVIVLCASSITLGTMFGGWNIIKTVGFGIYKVKIIHSLADQIGSAAVILLSSFVGAPTSTTQVVTTTLMGVGAGERPKHVRWSVAKNIVSGWLLNIPSSMFLGALYSYLLLKLFSNI
ncbi:MAG TPA: inorganic phosphate transporter [Bacteroidetes bacterium]|nr:inorganic phosphate transporter [Bacteroidota bacterium]